MVATTRDRQVAGVEPLDRALDVGPAGPQGHHGEPDRDGDEADADGTGLGGPQRGPPRPGEPGRAHQEVRATTAASRAPARDVPTSDVGDTR